MPRRVYRGKFRKRGRLGTTPAYTANPKYTANIRLLVASLAAAGALEEARRVGQALLQLEPGFHVRKFCDGYAYRDPERWATLARHLLLAGLPEQPGPSQGTKRTAAATEHGLRLLNRGPGASKNFCAV